MGRRRASNSRFSSKLNLGVPDGKVIIFVNVTVVDYFCFPFPRKEKDESPNTCWCCVLWFGITETIHDGYGYWGSAMVPKSRIHPGYLPPKQIGVSLGFHLLLPCLSPVVCNLHGPVLYNPFFSTSESTDLFSDSFSHRCILTSLSFI